MKSKAFLGVIGGSGLYSMSDLRDIEEHELETPYGKPSAAVVVGELEGERVAFLARHGIGHHIIPGQVNYRANIYALKSLGVERIISISACGSLREDFSPGEIIIPDEVFDLTRQRKGTPPRAINHSTTKNTMAFDSFIAAPLTAFRNPRALAVCRFQQPPETEAPFSI